MPILQKAIDSGKREPEEFTHIDFSGDFTRKLINTLNGEHNCIQLRPENIIELALNIQQELNKQTITKLKENNSCK
ncbi:MAG: hypothetical protein CL670_00670 [Balneola sp.]|nr:hypothetical protein [Balneola sp.]MBE77646.1 hypothetical protein [Balneola sp.]|tara:strand:+ start:492 stop:719 length:228 start_codon:yes stop_codon:yes gene_type:complete